MDKIQIKKEKLTSFSGLNRHFSRVFLEKEIFSEERRGKTISETLLSARPGLRAKSGSAHSWLEIEQANDVFFKFSFMIIYFLLSS